MSGRPTRRSETEDPVYVAPWLSPVVYSVPFSLLHMNMFSYRKLHEYYNTSQHDPIAWLPINHWVKFSKGHFKLMGPLNSLFPWILTLKPSPSCTCSYPLQICDSNHTFCNQAQKQPCCLHPSGAPTHLPLSHPFCLHRTYFPRALRGITSQAQNLRTSIDINRLKQAISFAVL